MSAAQINLRKRFFTWWSARFAVLVDKQLARWKFDLFSPASGRVLEIGAGSGVNVRYLNHCTDLILLEPNVLFHRYLSSLTPNVISDHAEAMDLPNESIDTVISSLVLCSVPDIQKALAEIKRILRPGGTYRFIEHIGAPRGTTLRTLQKWLSPVCQCLGDGCHPDRDITDNVLISGFEVVRLDCFEADINDPLVRHFVAGVLRKNS